MATACPKCRAPSLVRVHPEAPGTVLRCERCHGHWLSAEAVKGFGEVVDVRLTDRPVESTREKDRQTGLCPEGHGILRRARVEARDGDFHLERCQACRGVFFDAGELTTLATMHVLGQLDRYFDPDATREERRARVREHLDADVKATFGEAVFLELEDLVSRLDDHPKRSMALAWLTDRLTNAGEDE